MAENFSPHVRWFPLKLSDVKISDGMWGHRQDTNHHISLQHGYQMLDAAGNFHNLRLAAGQIKGEFQGFRFLDSDLYKWLEAVAYALTVKHDPTLQKMADETIELIAAAQLEDGYINTYYQTAKAGERWQNIKDGHELYCAGHLIEAAIAFYEHLGDDQLLKIARRFADHIDTVFGPEKLKFPPGHEELELALVKLYRITGEQRYLKLAQFFIDQRGQNIWNISNPAYYQDHIPVREADQLEGHAVRQLYLLSGMADIYMETGEQALLEAALTQWQDLVSGKLFITGGVGARHDGESFGEPHELPNDHCYCETCGAVASILWNWRMLQITGESRYADLIERTLFNGFLSGVALDGKGYFYVNPLLSRGDYGRQPWYSCACCPPNAMRLIASLAAYTATYDESGLQLHQYMPMTLEYDSTRLKVETGYPWNGQVSIVVEQAPSTPWTLQLRIPDWCDDPRLEINDAKQASDSTQNGYLQLERQWQAGDRVTLQLPVSPRLTAAHPRVDPTRGSVAIEYGPLVYCLEQIDQQANVLDVKLDTSQPLTSEWQPDLLGGIVTIEAAGYMAQNDQWGDVLYRPFDQATIAQEAVKLTMIPYHLWGNRDRGAMRVWVARA